MKSKLHFVIRRLLQTVFFSTSFLTLLIIAHVRDVDRQTQQFPQHGSTFLRKLLNLELKDAVVLYNLTSPTWKGHNANISTMHCLPTRTIPPTHVCIYSLHRDKYISAMLYQEGLWEPDVTKHFQKALDNYPNATVIDLGANIGYYTLLASKMQHDVIAVEPVFESVLHLQNAIHLNDVIDRVKVLLNAVSSRHEYMAINHKKDNQGGVSVHPITATEARKIRSKDRHKVVTSVKVDDLLALSNFSTAIMKIDIEGYECKAILSASEFFHSVYVPYVFTEWAVMFQHRHLANTPCSVNAMSRAAAMLTQHGYKPYLVKTGRRLDAGGATEQWRRVGDVYWKRHDAPELGLQESK